jgi:hypothetical protein
MASLVLSGDTSGSITVSAPAVAGSTTQTLVNVTGTLAPIVSGTAITLTNQTAPEFTSIPSWVKRITLQFSAVSSNGSSVYLVQIGSGSFSTSGYASASLRADASGNGFSSSTSGFVISSATAANSVSGIMTLTALSSTVWVASHSLNMGSQITTGGGTSGTLSGALDRIRLFIDGTQFFDAGTINILYE